MAADARHDARRHITELDISALRGASQDDESLLRGAPLLGHDDAKRLIDNGAGGKGGPQIHDQSRLLGPADGQRQYAGQGRRETACPAELGFTERAGARRVEVQRSDQPAVNGHRHRQRRPDSRGGGAGRELGQPGSFRGIRDFPGIGDAGDLPGAHCG
jgi:hypothetical protein